MGRRDSIESNDEEWEFRDVFRDYMKAELASKEVQTAKKTLIEDFFKPTPLYLTPQFMAPSMVAVFVMCFVLGLWMFPQAKPTAVVPTPQAATAVDAIPAPVTEAPVAAKENEETPPAAQREVIAAQGDVRVERVSSDVGPIMIFHREHQSIPLTIVWVFPAGGAGAP